MKFLVSIFIILSLTTYVHSQKSMGYYGKKNYISLSSNMHFPLIRMLSSTDAMWGFLPESPVPYVRKGNMLERKHEIFHLDYSFSYMRTVGKKTAVGLDFIYDRAHIQRPSIDVTPEYSPSNTYSTGIIERNKINVISIIPKVEICSNSGILPIGITHQFGLGINIASYVNTSYLFQPNYYNPQYTEELPSKMQYTGKSYIYPNFYYALNLRTPITKYLFLTTGFKYNVNMMFKGSLPFDFGEGYNENSPEYTPEIFRAAVKGTKRLSFVFFNIGLGYSF